MTEAIYLARLIVSLTPAEPEPQGLPALMLYCEARRPARLTADGAFVPIAQQDARLRTRSMIIEALGILTSAARHGRFGRYLCAAAIPSVHVQHPITGETNHAALENLYGLLQTHEPSLGGAVSHAAVLIELAGLDRAAATLTAIPAEKCRSCQPYWVTRAQLGRAVGDKPGERAALQTEHGLTDDPALRDHLTARMA